MEKKAIAATVAVTVIMGMTFLASSELLIYADSFQSAAIRWSFALVSMLALMALRLVKIEFKGKNWLHAAPVALFQPCLYAVCGISGAKFEGTIKKLMPMIIMLITALLLVAYIPQITLFLPTVWS